MNEAERSNLLAEQNDRFRKGDKSIPGTVVVTQGIDALSEEAKAAIFALVQYADDFDEGNDPYGEHDFGSVTHDDVGQVFWKIDYYEPTLTQGSEDPTNLKMTVRVLTIMLAME